MTDFYIFQLKNGIRIIYKPIKNEVAHCGFIINTGSRDEQEIESGITHFIEHTIFKGTHKRKSHHILNRIDNVGGEINAYTTKENTSIYASFTKQYLGRATELLTDILFNSTFPEKELIKEKDVIIDEISSYQDNPYEQIYDDFEELTFKGHPLGMNILGNINSVKNLNRDKILGFIEKNYSTNEIVFSIVGDYSLKEIKKITHKYLEDVPCKLSKSKRVLFKNNIPCKEIIEKEIFQSHCMIGSIAYGAHHKSKKGFVLLNNILGGPAMNSRLNMSIREKYGYAYNIESSYTIYSDVGLFNVYFGTDKKNIDKSIRLIEKELKRFKVEQISTSQLKIAKQQLVGQITLANENNCNEMLGIGKSLLLYDKVDSLKTTFNKIESITSKELQNIANEIFDLNKLSSLIYKPN